MRSSHPDPPGKIPYPSSLLSLVGTVWMTEILSLIRSRGCPSWSRAVLNSDRMPWFSTRLGLESALSYPSPRLLTCHLPRHIFPKSFSHSRAKVGWAPVQSFKENGGAGKTIAQDLGNLGVRGVG